MRRQKNGRRRYLKNKEELPLKRPPQWRFDLSLRAMPFVVSSVVTAFLILQRFGLLESVGAFLLTSFLYYLFFRDIKRYRPDYIKKYRMNLLLALLVPLSLAIDRGFYYFVQNFSHGVGLDVSWVPLYGLPVAFGTVVVTMVFDFHTAIIFSFTMSLLAGVWAQDAYFGVFVFLTCIVGAFSTVHCKRRSDLIRAGLKISGTAMVALTGIILIKGGISPEAMKWAYLYAAASGIVVSAFVSMALPMIEYIFRVATDISLLELLDLNHPLLKNLMIAAPGTYHHSIIVGNLVESVAEEIGVNPLLARAGAYYHDIGKIKMPEYFIENTAAAASRHESLTPHMSSMILAAHVKEGVELAKEFNLPEPLIDVIQQHHGTCLMTYFYQKAKDTLETEPKEEDYRYQGPKPKSRVAALVLLADAVEAASRSLKDPTPSRIENLVEKIVNHIFIDGQLEDCELTLKDISLIKKRFIYILTGIHHKRIDYPGFEFEERKVVHEPGYKEPSKKSPYRPKEVPQRSRKGGLSFRHR